MAGLAQVLHLILAVAVVVAHRLLVEVAQELLAEMVATVLRLLYQEFLPPMQVGVAAVFKVAEQ
jgi:hypothetical protein